MYLAYHKSLGCLDSEWKVMGSMPFQIFLFTKLVAWWICLNNIVSPPPPPPPSFHIVRINWKEIYWLNATLMQNNIYGHTNLLFSVVFISLGVKIQRLPVILFSATVFWTIVWRTKEQLPRSLCIQGKAIFTTSARIYEALLWWIMNLQYFFKQ